MTADPTACALLLSTLKQIEPDDKTIVTEAVGATTICWLQDESGPKPQERRVSIARRNGQFQATLINGAEEIANITVRSYAVYEIATEIMNHLNGSKDEVQTAD